MNPTPERELPAGIARSISREDLANLTVNRYHGPVHLVSTSHELAQALADIRQERVTGFDTETRPAFRKGEVYLPCLAQVATARAVYLFPLRHTEMFPALTELLTEARLAKAGVALADDSQKSTSLTWGSPRAAADWNRLACATSRRYFWAFASQRARAPQTGPRRA